MNPLSLSLDQPMYVYPAKYSAYYTTVGHGFLKSKNMLFPLFMSVVIVCHNLLNSTLKFVKYQTNDGHLTGHYSKKFNLTNGIVWGQSGMI